MDPRKISLELHTEFQVSVATNIMQEYRLNAFDVYLVNANSVNLPYHNKFHTSCMIDNCWGLALENQLMARDIRQLLTAAAYHDFDHTGGEEKDDVNIRLALEAYRRHTPEPDPVVEKLIRVTQYPFVMEPEDDDPTVSVMMKIIRDCDLMQSFRPTWFVHVILGLRAESFSNASIAELVKKNYEFVSTQKFYITNEFFLKHNLEELRVRTEEFLKKYVGD